MHETAIRDGDIPFDKGRAVQALTAFLIGQFDEAEAFGGQVEGTMKPPQPIVFLGVLPCFWNRGSIEQPDAPPFRRRPLVLAKQHANEVFHPAAAFAQALEQSDVGKVCKTHGRGPCARRSQSHPAKAISQDETRSVAQPTARARWNAPNLRAEASIEASPSSRASDACQSSFRCNSRVMSC